MPELDEYKYCTDVASYVSTGEPECQAETLVPEVPHARDDHG